MILRNSWSATQWDGLAAIAATIQAIGVLAALGYAAAQIRATREETRRERTDELIDRLITLMFIELPPDIRIVDRTWETIRDCVRNAGKLDADNGEAVRTNDEKYTAAVATMRPALEKAVGITQSNQWALAMLGRQDLRGLLLQLGLGRLEFKVATPLPSTPGDWPPHDDLDDLPDIFGAWINFEAAVRSVVQGYSESTQDTSFTASPDRGSPECPPILQSPQWRARRLAARWSSCIG